MARRRYVLRKVISGNPAAKGVSYAITIPQEIGDVVPGGTQFVAELVDDGILLRRVPDAEAPVLPAWVLAQDD